LSRSPRTAPSSGATNVFQPQSLVISNLAGGAGQTLYELAHFQAGHVYFHAAGFKPDQIEQVINQFEQPHSVGVHGAQEFFGIAIDIEALEQGFHGCDEQRQWCAQFMTDVGEESAFDLVKLDEFAVVFFNQLAIALQLETQSEFAEAQPAVKVTARYYDERGATRKKRLFARIAFAHPLPREMAT